MTLPSSGSISVSQMATEYGVSLPCVFPDAFYGKPGIAASGTLRFSDFYGQSNTLFSPDGGTINRSRLGANATITLSCVGGATWTFTKPGNVSATITSGSTSGSVSFTLPYAGGFDSASFTVTGVSGAVTRNFTLNLTVDSV